MHFSIDRTVHTTSFDKPVVDHWLERKIAQTAAGSTEKDRSEDRPLQRRARYRLSYIPLPCRRKSPFRSPRRNTSDNSVVLTKQSTHSLPGARRSSEVERSLMVRWVVGSILHGVDPLSYFSFQPVLHDWCNKGRGMCYPVCWMVHIKEPLLLIDKSSLCGGSGFPFSLSEWSLTICLTPYNRR